MTCSRCPSKIANYWRVCMRNCARSDPKTSCARLRATKDGHVGRLAAFSMRCTRGRRAFRLVIIAVALFAVVTTGVVTFLYWRSQKQNVRVYAALAKLQTGVANERELVESARRAKTEAEQNLTASTDAQRQTLQQENKELHDQIATADPSQVAELQKQLRASNRRLQKLETESTVAEDIILVFLECVPVARDGWFPRQIVGCDSSLQRADSTELSRRN